MNENKEFGPEYDLEEKPRTSSNNQQIVGLKYVALSDQEQAEVEEIFQVK